MKTVGAGVAPCRLVMLVDGLLPSFACCLSAGGSTSEQINFPEAFVQLAYRADFDFELGMHD